eukprot:NODE_1282_length_1010_cov_394.281998_g851_i1.p5 GENE.NODE_1282_length_1010_cov_394.281998_g851_i1~~NODE_1282_length_1010_cov_394.281998_g851_i1.p5  ORF type:complete len:86 (+),score=9.40 NODE_1282_length_1010_cov_394.281998_g851_i1:646-903(+)
MPQIRSLMRKRPRTRNVHARQNLEANEQNPKMRKMMQDKLLDTIYTIYYLYTYISIYIYLYTYIYIYIDWNALKRVHNSGKRPNA